MDNVFETEGEWLDSEADAWEHNKIFAAINDKRRWNPRSYRHYRQVIWRDRLNCTNCCFNMCLLLKTKYSFYMLNTSILSIINFSLPCKKGGFLPSQMASYRIKTQKHNAYFASIPKFYTKL